jgi:endonuclease/exonuclease/phosphatase family metal-dependent hydrolase
MRIKTLQWNIGGAKIREKNLDQLSENSYTKDGFDYVIAAIKELDPDIITLQETHAKGNSIQAAKIAKTLGYQTYVNDIYADSHIEKGQKLGQAIISKFPSKKHSFSLFNIPKFETIGPNGEKWIAHNKGLSQCDLSINEKTIQVKTLHMVPFRKFGLDPLSINLQKIRQDISQKAELSLKYGILQGDFNYNESSLKNFLPDLFKDDITEVEQSVATTPRGRKYDHIVYKNLTLIASQVITNALTDHFPIFSEFEIKI